VFVRENGTWKQQVSFKPSNTGLEDWFGVRLALSGDGNTLAIAGPLEDSVAQGINGKQDDNSALEAGAVYLFKRSAGTWATRSRAPRASPVRAKWNPAITISWMRRRSVA